MAATLPNLPDLPSGLNPGLVNYLATVKDILLAREGLKSNPLDSHITFRDLVDAGIVTSTKYRGAGSDLIKPKIITPPPVVPPPLDRLTATGQNGSICLTWDAIGSVNHAFVEIWRTVTPNDLATAELIDIAGGQLYLDHEVTPGQQYWYFLRSVSVIGIEGPFNEGAVTASPTAGAVALVEQLTVAGGFAVPGQPYFYVPPGGVTVNGEFIPEGTYIWNFVLANASIKGAQIQNAALNSGHFQSLDADKIEFNDATGKRMEAVQITGGLIQGAEIVGESISGGLIRGTRITSGGTEALPSFDLDGSNGTLRSNSALEDENDPTSYNFIELGQGTVRTGMFIPDFGHAIDQVLSRIETGLANSNEDTTLPGYWKSVPEVLVFPQELTLPDPASDAGDKVLKCSAANIQRLSTDSSSGDYYRVRFTPVALLSSDSGVRSVSVLSTLWDYADNLRRGSGLNYLANAGSKATPNFLVPQTASGVEISTTCSIYEWLDLEGSNYLFAVGAIYLQFYISSDAGATWSLVGTSGVFNSGGGAGLMPSAARNSPTVRHFFSFTPSVASRLGRVVYYVSQGGTVGYTDFIPQSEVTAPYARLYVYCGTLRYPVTSGDSPLTGDVSWVAVG